MTDRLAAVREKLNEAELDALLVSQPENRRYLSGFTGSAGVLIISAEKAVLATDFRYYAQAEEQAPIFDLVKVGYKFTDHLADLLTDAGVQRVGFESDHLTVARHERWQEAALEFEWIATSGLIEDQRAVKSLQEVDKIRLAVEVADEAFARVSQQLRPGVTERDVAWMMRAAMHDLGAGGIAFETIVAAGKDGAKPHYRPADKKIPAGVPIVIDMGAAIDGYHSDMTRTIVLGEPDATFREIYSLVLRAQERAVVQIRAGMTCVEADAVARDIIEGAGHADHFGHGLGHGVGLAVHEAPKLSFTASEDKVLKPGMVVTIEPGVYLPDWGGVRIEDMAVVSEDGLDILTQTLKAVEAQIIPVS